MDYLYRANDGTVFYDEDECIRYEISEKYIDKFNDVILWDEHNKKISPNDIIKENSDVEEIWAVYFPNDEVAEMFNEAVHDIFNDDLFCYDITMIGKGLYIYDENICNWIKVEDTLKTISKNIEKLGYTFNYTIENNCSC